MKKITTIFSILFLLFFGKAFSQWTAKATFAGVGRAGAVGFSIGTMGYIGTGYDNTNGLSDFWEWNQSTNSWTQKATFPGGARTGAIGFSIGTKGYLGTGWDPSTGSDYGDFWEWNQATNTWTQKAAFAGGPIADAVGFSIGSKGYIGTSYLGAQFWEWDQGTNIWTQKANFPGIARSHAAGFVIGTNGYIGTGVTTSSGVSLNDLWEWDQPTNTWVQKASCTLHSGRDAATGFSIGNIGFIGTGHNNNNGFYYRTFFAWNQAANTWSSVTTSGFGLQSGFCASFTIGTKGYVGTGGDDQGNLLKEFYELSYAVGIEELSGSENLFSVSPNPSAGDFMVSLHHPIAASRQLTIYNVEGKLIYTVSFTGTEKQIHLDAPNGIYFVTVSDESRGLGMVVRKVVKM